MATITLTPISNGDSGDATVVDTNFDTVAGAINGGLDTANFTANNTSLSSIAKADAWTNWTPTLSGSGSLAISSTSINRARYRQIGKDVEYMVDISYTTGGTTSNTVFFTTPVTAKDTYGTPGSGLIIDDSGLARGAFAYFSTTTSIGVQRYDVANLALGSGKAIRISGIYEAA